MKSARALFALALIFAGQPHARAEPSKMDFWSAPRRGANYHNHVPTREWLVAAKAAGIRVVRLFPNSWPTARRDFLLGDADRFTAIDEQDFQLLKRALDDADSVGLKIVLTTVSLPGLRWRQHNNEVDDRRLWRDAEFRRQAADFWRQLAARLRGHPAVVGYNLVNEPHPERGNGFDDFWTEDFTPWYERVRGTPADLNLFNEELVATIREVDRETPVVVESGLYATPWAFKYLRPLRDKRVIYSFHTAEPWDYTTRRVNRGRYRYPGVVPVGNEVGGRRREVYWDAAELERFLAPVAEWQKKHRIPSSRIFVGEFGCSRSVEGAAEYLRDLVGVFERHGWHWAFYQFRTDSTWTERDYEYGTSPPPAGYWEAVGRGERPPLRRVEDNPVWNVLKAALRR